MLSIWEEYYSIKEEYSESTWEFLEDFTYDYKDSYVSRYDFLHGCCEAFAFVLHKRFGYDVYEIPYEGETINHAFCFDSGDYIDIRGRQKNFKLFYEDFEDWMDTDEAFDSIEKLTQERIDELYHQHEEKNPGLLEIANQIIDDFLDEYKPLSVINATA